MQMPALRLPAWRPSFEWPEGLLTRRVVLYGLYTAVLFGVFLFAHLPYRELVHRLLQSAQPPGMHLEVADVRFAWWRGFELQGVRVAPADPSQPAYFEATSLYVRPAFSDLLRGRVQSVDVSGSLYGGSVKGSLSRGEINRVSLTFDGLQLQGYPLLAAALQGGQVEGRASGAISVEGRTADLADLRAAGDVRLDQASLSDAKWNQLPLAPLHFNSIATRFDLNSGRLELQQLKGDGKEIVFDLDGQVALRSPLADSVLNLKVQLTPGPEAPEDTKTLIAAIMPPPAKGAKADAPKVLSGTLAKPRLR
ncbi:MAG: type II secretion system protein GspN [Candidatus Binatia bacterium]